MARSRNIKPGFFINDELGEMPPEIRLLFIGLWTVADREGRLKDRPKRIQASCTPYDQINVNEALNLLQENGFLIRYSVGGENYIQINNWHKHQNPHHKEAASEIPKYQKDKHEQVMHESSMPHEQVKQTVSCPTDSLNLIPDSLNKKADKRPRFVKPTVEEIKTYCLERKNQIDPQEFFDHYEANGWKRGKTPIADWKACVRTWESQRKNNPQPKPRTPVNLKDDLSMNRLGKQLGILPKAGESQFDYNRRILEAQRGV